MEITEARAGGADGTPFDKQLNQGTAKRPGSTVQVGETQGELR